MTVGKPFKKGQSGNPGGRPKVVAEVKELAREHTGKAIETFVSIMSNPKAAPAARVSAANALLDRGYGLQAAGNRACNHSLDLRNVVSRSRKTFAPYDAAVARIDELHVGYERILAAHGRTTMNSAISQLEAFITRLDRQRAHIEVSLMDQTRPAQDQEQLAQTYDLLFELRQIAATSLAVVQRLERELAHLKEQENGNEKDHSGT